EAILREYTRPVAFYVWATALPWGFWFAAAYLSHLPAQSQAVLVSTGAVIGRSLLAPGRGRRIHLEPAEASGGYRRQAEMAGSGPVAVGSGRSVLGPGQPLGGPGRVPVLRLWSRPVLPARSLHLLRGADARLGDPHRGRDHRGTGLAQL